MRSRPSNPHLPKQQLLRRVRIRGPPNLLVRNSALRPIHILDIVLQNQACKDHLDLVGRKEPTWASVLPISKEQVLLIRRDELVSCILRGGAGFADFGKAESIECAAAGVHVGVLIDGAGWDFDQDPGWDVLAI